MDVLTTLDMRAEDEDTIAARLDHEIAALALAGARYVVVDLGDRPRLSHKTADAVALAHRELRAMGGQMVVVGTPKAAHRCAHESPGLMIAATLRQARDALGPGALPTD
jgi:anti-anti-sigma regulatory factor